MTGAQLERWRRTKPGAFARAPSGNTFGFMSKEHPDRPCATVTASCRNFHWSEPRMLTAAEIRRAQTFPEDYDFGGSDPVYVMGMSVPPYMVGRVAALLAAEFFDGGKMELRTGPWKMSDIRKVRKNGLRAFSCFACGGGSSMGYKLAGYDVLGYNEIDPEMAALYDANLNPKHRYVEPIQEFKKRKDLPRELYDLDVLDGSPPCSSFSMAGSREKAWGKKKKFREGQTKQVLDDLFFHFIDVAAELRPKVVVAENVKGLVMGNARGYVKEIFSRFRSAGYSAQLFLLNSSRMGVPQVRERTFFVASRSDLGLKKVSLVFNEDTITARSAFSGLKSGKAERKMYPCELSEWPKIPPGGKSDRYFSLMKAHPDRPAPTITAKTNGAAPCHWSEPRYFTAGEYVRLQSFPDDYAFGRHPPVYVCGMSVPPFMMQRLARAIFERWFRAAPSHA